nr:MAG TPA: hypothetical protein [Caudoviricetes sp.]
MWGPGGPTIIPQFHARSWGFTNPTAENITPGTSSGSVR